jgi:hypothetical protein
MGSGTAGKKQKNSEYRCWLGGEWRRRFLKLFCPVQGGRTDSTQHVKEH